MEGGAGLVGAQAAPADGLIKDTTTASFGADVVQESRKQPVLVDFWAPWCGPCKQLQPALEKVVAAAKGRVKLVKMNIDDHPSIAGQLGIQSIPAVIAFKDGQPVDGFMGAVPESKIVEFIDKVAGPGNAGAAIEDALAAAGEARAAGDLQGAVGIYSAVLAEEPGHPQASAALATLLLDAGQKDDALSVLEQVPADKAGHADMLAVKARLDLDAQVAGLGDPAALERRLAADPADHEARFDLALIQNARGDRAAATESLLAIVKADREWREDGARAQLLKFFEAWGMTDPATLAARRKLSSVLFS
ncbi:thioredoxin [Aliihoeflea sp. 2WW]|uniref:thioredoxin n=1 Tax=Aliihoeflea sp. 2WW TaxID=1381123 RepID=UPI001FCC4447|nr:thioredoxin [Aliihoeflea sp. 2WW]